MKRETDHFKAIGEALAYQRDDLDLTVEDVVSGTNLRAPWIHSLEAGDFEFAEPVFIKGYLKQYAQFLRLDWREFLESYETIVEKIHFLENERFVEVQRFNADTDVSPRDMLEVFRASEEESESELDAQVRDKILREKRVNAAVMGGAGVLIALTAFYLYLDLGKLSSHRPYWRVDEPEQRIILPTNRTTTRARMVLSDPLLTEEEIYLQEEEARFVDSLNRHDNLFSGNLKTSENVDPVSIFESAEYLRKRYEQ